MMSLLSQELSRRATIDKTEWALNEWGWLNRDDGHVYKPNTGGDWAISFEPDGRGQEAFHTSQARFRALIGSRGSGKTATGVQEALRMVRERPGLPGAMVSPNMPHWTRSTWPEVQRWIPWDRVVQHHKTEKWILFDNGSTVYYGGIDDPDSWRGPNLNWLWFDEAARKRDIMAFLVLVATVRIAPDPMAWITTTPRGKSHWLTKFFIERDLPDEVAKVLKEIGHTGPLIESFHTHVEDNKENVDPAFYASLLMAYTGPFKRQEVGGDIVEEGGTLAQRTWFEIVESVPTSAPRVRGWDLAATAKKVGSDPDYVGGAKLAYHKGTYYIEHMIRRQLGPGQVEQLLIQTAKADGRKVRIGIEEEPGASGKLLGAHLVKLLTGYWARSDRASGDKVTRAMPWLGQAQAGNVKLLEGSWNECFLDEVEEFPVGSHDDQVDAVSVAFQMLTKTSDPRIRGI